MTIQPYSRRSIKIVRFDDNTSDEQVFEFIDSDSPDRGPVFAISVPDDGGWDEASISVSPRFENASLDLVVWAIEAVKKLL
ncbi:hypothetical protein [Kitasatospora sp. NPDC058478]|uniref:hypothetical protein n=1 Tax=unclassified Kitasatospora TaxID=2633591 RepID=UPI0036625DE7